MKSVGDLDSSMLKALSAKKTSGSSGSENRTAIRRKLERIKRKLRAGGRLTPSEKEFLRKYAPGLYQEAIAAEQERAAYEERLKQCRSREEAERVKTEKMMELMAKKDEALEVKVIRGAQVKAAEAAVETFIRRLPSLVDQESRRREAQKKRKKIQEEKERERLSRERRARERQTRERIQKKRVLEQHYESERILEKQKERYWEKEAGIYKRPIRKTSEAKVQEEFEHKEAVIAGNIDVPGAHAAFARGHAAYQAAAEAAREYQKQKD